MSNNFAIERTLKYIRNFSGEQHFQPAIPCLPIELTAFRQCIGEPGVELILQQSIRV